MHMDTKSRGHKREHAAARTRTGARVPHDVEPLLLADPSREERAVRLERVDSSHVVALLEPERGAVDVPHTGLDRTAVDDDRRPVVAHGSHKAAGHVLIASISGCELDVGWVRTSKVRAPWNRDIAVVVLTLLFAECQMLQAEPFKQEQADRTRTTCNRISYAST